MKVLPCFLFCTRKANVGMFMVSWPFCTGCTKAQAGTTMSVVVFIMCTSTQLSPLGRLRDGAASGLISCSAIVSAIYFEYFLFQWDLQWHWQGLEDRRCNIYAMMFEPCPAKLRGPG